MDLFLNCTIVATLVVATHVTVVPVSTDIPESSTHAGPTFATLEELFLNCNPCDASPTVSKFYISSYHATHGPNFQARQTTGWRIPRFLARFPIRADHPMYIPIWATMTLLAPLHTYVIVSASRSFVSFTG